MDAAPIMAHVNPLKKLREVLTTCGRGGSVYSQRNEARPKQWPVCSLALNVVSDLQLSGGTRRRLMCCPPKKKEKKKKKQTHLSVLQGFYFLAF